jgi:hypothetical protein
MTAAILGVFVVFSAAFLVPPLAHWLNSRVRLGRERRR